MPIEVPHNVTATALSRTKARITWTTRMEEYVGVPIKTLTIRITYGLAPDERKDFPADSPELFGLPDSPAYTYQGLTPGQQYTFHVMYRYTSEEGSILQERSAGTTMLLPDGGPVDQVKPPPQPVITEVQVFPSS